VAIDGSNPYLGEYDAYALQAKTAYQKALAKIATQRTGFQTGYGLGPDGQPLANAPYGQYQQMMGGMAQQAEQSDALLSARGLQGGISRQAQEAVQRQNRQTTYDFGQNYQAGLTAFSDAEQEAGTGYNQGLFEKMSEITQRAIQDRMFTPAAPGAADLPGYGDPLQPNPTSPGLPWKPPVRSVKPKRRRRRRRRR
jgi:hypothetical protein